MDYNIHHLGKDSEDPIKISDEIIFVNMRFCPFTHSSMLMLISRKVPFKLINVDTMNKPKWLFKWNPIGTVPVMILPTEEVLIENEFICDYLDEAFYSSKHDPLIKARVRDANKIIIDSVIKMFGVIRNDPNDEESLKQIAGDCSRSCLTCWIIPGNSLRITV